MTRGDGFSDSWLFKVFITWSGFELAWTVHSYVFQLFNHHEKEREKK
jgi:hypothetical protein